MAAEKRSFQAEVSKLLHIVANSLYSEREVFLRELISNASDACDKLRYMALTQPELAAGDTDFRVDLTVDKEAGTLTISDNGIGMSEDEIHENLGTIARSGTEAFVAGLKDGDEGGAVSQIGRFGVGFYSAFMVADKVEVLSRKAGEDTAFRWESDGLGEYSVEAVEKAGRGTMITLHLKEDAEKYLEEARLETVVKTYSDHIQIPVNLTKAEGEPERLNQASALWARSKSEIEDAQYAEFYKHVSHAFDHPWLTVHWRAEGLIEYASLLFVPASRPFDLFHPERKHRVKLYVKRVFITDECEGLVPSWLRFIKGVIDCEDLPLNISREMLQNNPVVTKIGTAVTKRILNELKAKAEDDPESYKTFWGNFGAVLKEGLYSDAGDHKAALLGLSRFKSTGSDGLVSLADYVGRMKEGQEAIYYIVGDSEDTIRISPHLEGYRAKGVEVLLLSDPIDDFWVSMMFEGFEGKQFQSVTRGSADLDKVAAADEGEKKDDEGGEKSEEDSAPDLAPLVASLKLALGDKVKDVRVSQRLTDSAVCLVADEGDMDMNLERMLRQHKQVETAATRILEVNPAHTVIKGLNDRIKGGKSGAEVEDAAFLLLDQARILDGDPPLDPLAFSRRLALMMSKGLAG